MTLDKLIIATRLCLLAVFLVATGNSIALFGALPYLWLIFPVLGGTSPCTYCTGGTQNTSSMQIDIAGVTNGICTDCANFNATHIVTFQATCAYRIDSLTLCTSANNGTVASSWQSDGSVFVEIRNSAASFTANVSSASTSTPRDCSSATGLSGLAFVAGAGIQCTVTGATATVTP